MATVERFEDLIVWQKSRALAKAIYAASARASFARDFGLKDQIQRAAVSIMSNIAEGFERRNPGEFHQFLSIARGSCAEVRSQLYIAHDIGHLTETTFNQLLDQVSEVARLLGGLQSYIARCKPKKTPPRPSQLGTRN